MAKTADPTRSRAKSPNAEPRARRARPQFKLIPTQILYRSDRKNATYILSHVQQALDAMWDEGYVLGTDQSAWIEPGHAQVVGTAIFIGEDAWAAAQVSESFSLKLALQEKSVRRAYVEARMLAREDGGLPVCRCEPGSTPPLDLWCTPKSKAPPLLCSEGGVVQYWKLPLSDSLKYDLNRWRHITERLANMALEYEPVDRCPYHEQATAWLADPNSWISGFSKSLAQRTEAELGRKVRAFNPPYHPFRL
jgi:hypothetical protein